MGNGMEEHTEGTTGSDKGQGKQHRSYWSRFKQSWKQTTGWNKAIVIFTAVIAVSNVTYTFYARRQWQVANQTLTEIRKGSADTHDLARAAGKQADYAKAQSEQAKAQVDKMRESLTKTDSLIAEATKQAEATNRLAEAARKSVDTAKETLHVSERAYVVMGEKLEFDEGKKAASLSIINIGRIPSGPVEIINHQVTMDVENPAVDQKTIISNEFKEFHWRRFRLDSVAPQTTGYFIVLPIPTYSKAAIEAGTQRITIAGTIKYNDGFPDDPTAEWTYCWNTVYQVIIKSAFWAPCYPKFMLPQLEKVDGYPNNEGR
jgi:hypothetical protein